MNSIAEKTDFIYQKIKSKIVWDKSQTFYADSELEEVWKEGTGNSAEINLLLLNLLRKVKITSFPVIISTRDNGKPDKEFISLSQFNGVDVLVQNNDEIYILDAADKHQSYTNPPLNILNRDVLIIDEEKSMWVSVSDKRPLLKAVTSGLGFINENGVMTGEASSTFHDQLKTQMLNEKNKPADEREKENKEFIEKNSNDVKIDSLSETDAEDALKPLNTKFKFEYKLSNSGDIYFIDPFFLSSFRKNPFIDSTRRTEIDFGANQYYSTSMYIDVGGAMSIEEIPKSKLLRTPDSSMLFKRIINRHENTIQFKTTFEFSRTVFYPEEYEMVREFFKNMYAIIDEQILLKKKK